MDDVPPNDARPAREERKVKAELATETGMTVQQQGSWRELPRQVARDLPAHSH